jgi:thiamine biosynthesis lipoprotein
MAAQPMPRPADESVGHQLDHDPRTMLRGPAYEWPLWSTTVRVVTADPHALPSARRLVDAELARVELATSRRRRDSEVATLPTGRRARISGTLADILGAALEVARDSDGAVDLTPVRPLTAVDTAANDDGQWRGIELDRRARTVLVPRGVELDLEPVARACAADRCAETVAETLDVGILVSLGGDIATAGPAGDGAWEILVGGHPDRSEAPAALVAIPTGLAAVTSTGASGRYRSATVVAPNCVTALTWSAVALDPRDLDHARLAASCLPTRLVEVDGSLTYLGGWPEDGELTSAI